MLLNFFKLFNLKREWNSYKLYVSLYPILKYYYPIDGIQGHECKLCKTHCSQEGENPIFILG